MSDSGGGGRDHGRHRGSKDALNDRGGLGGKGKFGLQGTRQGLF